MRRGIAQQPRDVQIVERVKYLAAGAANPDEPGGAENTELMRCRRFGQTRLGRKIGHSALAMTDKVKQRKTRRVAQDLEQGRHFRHRGRANHSGKLSDGTAHGRQSYEYMSKCSYVKFKAHVVAFCFANALSHPVLE